MRVEVYDPNDVLIDPTTRARKGDPNPTKVKRMAESMLSLREEGKTHQIQPGAVRINENGQPVVIFGEHRLMAERLLNSNLPDGAEPFMFYAIPTHEADDTSSLEDALTENLIRVDSTIFDKGDAFSRLVGMGSIQADIAKRYGISEGQVSDAIAASKLPKKYQRMVTGDDKTGPVMTEEAAIVFARIKDKDLQEEIIQASFVYQQTLDEIADRSANPEEVEEEPEETGEEPETKPKKEKGKAPTSDAVRNKKKKAAAKKPGGKVTAEAAKAAARSKGAMREATGKRSAKTLMLDLETYFGPKVTDESIPQSVRNLVAKIEEYLDGDVGIQGLRNGFLKCCRPDGE